MSLCIAFYYNNKFLVCADSNVSSEINGEKYLVTDEYRKIRKVGDKVVFLTGDVDIAEKIFNTINDYSSITFIQRKVQKAYNEFYKVNKDNPAYKNTKYGIEMGVRIFTFENGKGAFYQMHQANNFDIDRQEPDDKNISTSGAFSPEALKYVLDLINAGMNVEKSIMKTYEHFSNEQVGGNLHSFVVANEGITELPICKIKDEKIYKKWSGREFNFHSDMSGNFFANKATIKGSIDCDSLFIQGASVLASGGTQINGNYINSIRTDQIIAGNAKIGTALIENLVVGGNVTMGPNATINWATQVTGKPSIPSTAADVGALPTSSPMLTNITSNGIYTGTVTADKVVGNTFTAMNSIGIGVLGDYATKSLKFNDQANISTTGGGTALEYNAQYHWFNNEVFFKKVDFTGATITGLNVVAKFG